jgi:hypothetical protein
MSTHAQSSTRTVVERADLGGQSPTEHVYPLRSRSKATSSPKDESRAPRKSSVQATSRKKATVVHGTKEKATPGVVYIATVAHSDEYGEHDETLGVYASKAACAKVVREHIERVYGTDLVDEYEVNEKENGFVSVYAHGWEGESMRVYMQKQQIQS